MDNKEAEKSLTEKDTKDEPLASPNNDTSSNDNPKTTSPPNLQTREPIVIERPKSEYTPGSALTLPLPERPLSSVTGSENENIYDQLPATLPRKPQTEVKNDPPPPVQEQPEKVDTLKIEKKDEEEREPTKRYGDINTHRTCTIITMILCGVILNVFAFFCLIPAYLYSKKSKESLEGPTEDITEAEKYAKRSLILNLVAVIVTFLVFLGVFIVLQVVFGATGLYTA